MISQKIISNFFHCPEFAFKILPFTKAEYFKGNNRIIVSEILRFFTEFGTIPKPSEIKIEVEKRRGISDKDMKEILEQIDGIQPDASNFEWLVNSTEKYYQEQSLINAIMSSVEIIDRGENQGKILDMVQNAMAVSFDSNLGHDYFRDVEKRFEGYHTVEDKVSWGIRSLDEISKGGISKKNLVCLVAVTGSGKSLAMCSIAANVVKNGGNVLYISMEMSEQRVAERIDANLFNTDIDDIQKMDYKRYSTTMEHLSKKNHGRLIIKEYPTSGAHVGHFRSLLKELKMKQNFTPDLVVVDYMNICLSARIKPGQSNSYGIVKSISEELRGLAVEFNVALLTATQTNRSGFNNSDLDMTDISESIGSTFVMDMALALARTPELDEQNEIMVKQLKNRYGDLTKRPVINLGLNRARMRLYDLDETPSSQGAEFIKREYMSVPKPLNVPQQAKMAEPKNDFSKFQF